ncbi:MAG: flagellar basal body L-ring protein FlgH [Bdellovibrionales bacterium]|nr:flagellar basal body L-ring protein FlgH [Bdellovibrionales bacterium]
MNSRSSIISSVASLAAFWTLLAGVVGMTTGCAGFNRGVQNLVQDDRGVVKYSDQANLRHQGDRKYRRMNRGRMEEEAELGSQAGSLWVMEGQGAYLFAQNQTRMMGDLLNVRVEGNPRLQLSSKARVISKLLERLDNPVRGLAAARAANTQATGGTAPGASEAASPDAQNAATAGAQPETGAAGATAGAGVSGGAPGADKASDASDPINAIQTVPTRIVEQLKDGSYRVKGVQPFMIGRREYRVIVTGVVRQEDFDDSGVDASKLLDSQFDIVSARKGGTTL